MLNKGTGARSPPETDCTERASVELWQFLTIPLLLLAINPPTDKLYE